MALADAADDQGACWPSIATLARKCTVSTRTMQRSLRTLIDSGLLIAELRQRRDGSSTSNRYRLLIAGGDNLSPPLKQMTPDPVRGVGATPTRLAPQEPPIESSEIHGRLDLRGRSSRKRRQRILQRRVIRRVIVQAD